MDISALHVGDYISIVWIIIVFLGVMIVFWLIGGREWIGDKVAKVLPHDTLSKSDKAHIYLNGRYNRTATISKVEADALYIYDGLVKLPLDYRARFYGIGRDGAGCILVYIATRKHFRFIRLAELLRKLFNLFEDETNLIPDHSKDEQSLTEKAEEGYEDEM